MPCDPSPHAPRCEPDAEPVFAAPWRVVPGSRREAPRLLLDEDIAVTIARLAAACRPRARLVRYPGRPGEPADYPVHVDLVGAAGGRAWEEPIELGELEEGYR
jgi:hypothetical protein